MRLFLASANNTLSLLAKNIPKAAKVIFIENASDNYSGDKWWIKADREALEKIGCKITGTDLRSVSKEILKKQLAQSDLIHFCGGNVLYLISLLKKNGLDSVVIEKVREGKIVYSGTSAGSMIAAPNLSLSKYDDEDAEFAKTLTDFKGLDLVNFLIIPHNNNKDFLESNKKMLSHLAENLIPLVFLDDNHAVWVEDNKFEILAVK